MIYFPLIIRNADSNVSSVLFIAFINNASLYLISELICIIIVFLKDHKEKGFLRRLTINRLSFKYIILYIIIINCN